MIPEQQFERWEKKEQSHQLVLLVTSWQLFHQVDLSFHYIYQSALYSFNKKVLNVCYGTAIFWIGARD